MADDEMEPTVVEATRPGLVVWSSLWPDRPNDRIRFTITDDGWEGSDPRKGASTLPACWR